VSQRKGESTMKLIAPAIAILAIGIILGLVLGILLTN
jgi:hypothetical protein